MVTLPAIKKGDTLAFIAKLKDENGDPITGETANLKSQVRTYDGTFVADFVIEETETNGSYLLKAADTSTWPVGSLLTDIQYTKDEIVTSSANIVIQIVKDVTS